MERPLVETWSQLVHRRDLQWHPENLIYKVTKLVNWIHHIESEKAELKKDNDKLADMVISAAIITVKEREK